MAIADLPGSASSTTGTQFTCFVVTKVKVDLTCCYKSEDSGPGDSVPEEGGGTLQVQFT